MPKYLVLPKIGLNMEEGVISEWLIKPGDKVEKEQMVVRAETDKAVQDIFATESGIVYKLLVQPGDVVPCQEKIAVLLDEGEEYTEQQEPEEAKTKTDLSISKSEAKKHILEDSAGDSDSFKAVRWFGGRIFCSIFQYPQDDCQKDAS